MATKKKNLKKVGAEKSTLVKIGETIGTIAGEIAVKKDQLVHMASDAFGSVKSSIQNIVAKKKAAPKKAKAAVKKVAKKAIVVKKAAKKVIKKAVKKTVPAKKAGVKKVTKKVVKKASK